MPPNGDWSQLERSRKRLLILSAISLPLAFVALVLLRGWWKDLPWLLIVFVIPWVTAVIYLALRVGYWPCPRCGKPFFYRYGLFPAGGKECAHCGLPYGRDG